MAISFLVSVCGKIRPNIMGKECAQLNGGRDILDQVRELLGRDNDSPGSFEIKDKLIGWGGGDNFPDEHSWAQSYLTEYLVKLFREHGIASVQVALKELEAELEKRGLKLPNYYRQDHPNTKLSQALKIARKNDVRWAREREERRQR